MTSDTHNSKSTKEARLLRAVGQALYGPLYKRDLALGLGISRSTLHLWLAGSPPRRGLVEALHGLIARERVRLMERDVTLSKVSRMLARKRAKQQQQEIANE